MKQTKTILKYLFAFLPALLATFIIVVARKDLLLDGQFISVCGVGFVGILYSISLTLFGIFGKKNSISITGIFFLFSSVVALVVGFISEIPICNLNNEINALSCYP